MSMPFAKALKIVSLLLIIGLSGCSVLQSKPEPKVLEANSPVEAALPLELTNMFSNALALLKEEEFKESEQLLLEITNKYPNYAGPWTNLAITQLSLEKYDDSLVSVDKALVIDNQFCQSLSLKGVILREQGKFEDAKTAYLNAIECDSSDIRSLYNLGVLSDLYLHDEVTALFYYQSYLVALNNIEGAPNDSTVESWVVGLKRRVPEEQRMTLDIKKNGSEESIKSFDGNAQPQLAGEE